MSSIVLELQQEVLKTDCDILNALRKAHVIASKLQLKEFDAWIIHELNGYSNLDEADIPEYRKVKGSLKARNPYQGWIPVEFDTIEIHDAVCTRYLREPISSILELHKNSKHHIQVEFSGEFSAWLEKRFTTPFPTNYKLEISSHYLKEITDKVITCLLEWTIKLESEGVLGEGMQFSQEETVMAQKVSQTINNYYGAVFNGDMKQSQLVFGDNNTLSFNYEQPNAVLQKVKESIKDELPSGEDKEIAEELVAEVETKIANKAKPGIIKAALSGLKDFLIGSGANVAGALIIQYLQYGSV